MVNLEDYTCEETEDSIAFKSNKRNDKGFIINVSFTKDQEEHDESMKAIKSFFVREVL